MKKVKIEMKKKELYEMLKAELYPKVQKDLEESMMMQKTLTLRDSQQT